MYEIFDNTYETYYTTSVTLMEARSMSPILWIIIALGAAAGWSYLTLRRTQQVLRPIKLPDGERLPTTPMQRAAWQALVPTVLCVLVAAGIVAWYGVIYVWDNDQVRLTVTFVNIAALAGYTYWIARVRTWLIRDDTLDERDRAILAAAPAGQAPAMMAAMAAWMLYLIERFHTTHLVPSAYLYAMFWTVLLTSIVAGLLGVLVGYRRI
jgi:hypothetical protein